MSSKSNARKHFLIGAAVGGAIGAVTALLFAPKPGRELRSDIAEQVRQATGKTQDIARNIGEHTAELFGRAKGVAASVVEEVRSWKEEREEAEEAEEPRELAGISVASRGREVYLDAADDEDDEDKNNKRQTFDEIDFML